MENCAVPNSAFHHIALRAKDFDRTVDFYQNGLGFQTKCSWGDESSKAIMLDLGDGGCIEIFSHGSTETTDDYNTVYGQWLHLAIKTSDVRKAFTRALEYGAKAYIEPKDIVIEAKPNHLPAAIAFVYGPEGEMIELFEEKL